MKVLLPAAALALAVPGVALAKVTAVDDLRPGAAVMVKGTVERITDEDEFVLADASGRVLVYIGPNAMPVREGERIVVSGRVDDDGPLEIYAAEITLDGGRTVEFTYRY